MAKDGSGDFTSIQEAIDTVRDYTPERVTIYVKNGVYEEKILVPEWKTDITLIGENADSTIITWSDYSGKGDISTFTSYTVRVEGNGFIAENITFANEAGPVGQAVALHVEGDRCVFRNCKFLGNQDTLFAAGTGSRQYYENCYIEGTTDFIFGAATAVFQDCLIHSKKNSYITAASTTPAQSYGYVFFNCKLTAGPGVEKVYLGRPWRDHARTVFIDCEMGPHILSEGWHNWGRPEAELGSFYAEYASTGPGADPSGRVSWSHQLTRQERDKYTLQHIFTIGDTWEVFRKNITVFMAGNSTMADKPYAGSNPEKGWGQVFHLYFKEEVKVENHAMNGRSTKSFIDEGRWDSLLSRAGPGDYVIIEFGHNDQKKGDPSRYAAADAGYRQNLQRFIADVREKGATPVLATPIMRRRFDENGRFYDTHGRYPEVVRELAAAANVPLLDLHKQTGKLLRQYGEERSKALFLHIEPGEYENLPQGLEDDTHLSGTGAFKICDLAVAEMKTALPELYKHLK